MRPLLSQGVRGCFLGSLPDLDAHIKADRGKARSIWRPGNSGNKIIMPAIGKEMGAGSRFPNLYGFIFANGSDAFPIRGPGNGVDSFEVVAVGDSSGASGDIPELDGAIIASGG